MEMRMSVEKEKHEFELFLKQLTEKLEEIDRHLIVTGDSREESYKDGKKLDELVREQVDTIETTVNEAEDLNELKASVHERLQGIRTHMRLFVDAEEKRHQQAQDQLQTLNKKMEVMEKETVTLRSKITEERKQALIDPLTGVNNRLAYNERFQQEYSRWKRYGSPLTLLIWDIDYFKKINDKYGHKAGDKALKTIATVINNEIRETDFFGRFGGEEFVALLPETTLDAALVVADKIRKLVEECEFHNKDERVLITVSCGISELRRGDSIETVFERADKHLYRAKQAGRNCCKSDRDQA
jgi:diguanylate cyclase